MVLQSMVLTRFGINRGLGVGSGVVDSRGEAVMVGGAIHGLWDSASGDGHQMVERLAERLKREAFGKLPHVNGQSREAVANAGEARK
jgi:hypothetical protein